MKISLLAPALDSRAGGIAAVVDSLGGTLRASGFAVSAQAPVRVARWKRTLGFSASRSLVRSIPAGTELVHTHGLWLSHSRAGAVFSRKHGTPEIISPHGMLDPWALRNRAWKKRLVWALWERRHLERASVIHALCDPERAAIRALGIRTPVAVIPNGVNLPGPAGNEGPPWAGVFEAHAKVLLFLGRIHPKKGVLPLIEAWGSPVAKAWTDQGWRLALLGWDENGHGAECRAAIERLRIADTCRWFGPAFGAAKTAAYANASAFVLPSFSEGLPMTVLEAWSHRLPVFMTDACNLPEGFAAGSAVRITTETDGMIAEFQRHLAGTDAEARLEEMGEAGRGLVERDFTWQKVADKFAELYRWSAGGGARPGFVDG